MTHIATPLAGSSVTSGTSATFAFSSSVASGHTLIGTINTTEIVATPTITVTDTKSNTYSVNVEIQASATDMTAVFSAPITNALTTSDTLTVAFSDGTHNRWAISVEEFDDILTSPLDKTVTNTGSGTSLTTTATATTTAANELVFGGFGVANSSAKTFTPGSGFSSSPQQTTSAGTTDRGVWNEWKYVTSNGAQTASATLNVSTTWSAIGATYKSSSGGNNPPTANAGTNQSVAPFATVTLDGTGSSDSDGTVSSYAWTQTGGTTVTLSSASASQPTFTAPGVDNGTSLTFSLTVTDNLGASSSPSTVTVTVSSATEFVVQSGSWQAAQALSLQSGSWQ